MTKYPEIENIFIDIDVYIHRRRLTKKEKQINPLTARYLEGYKDCFDDIKNRIRELIEETLEDDKDLTEEDLEAQAVDAAERENHRREVEEDK